MTLSQPPKQLRLSNGTTAFGLYAGPMGPIDLRSTSEFEQRSKLWNALHLKRWMYVLIASESHVITAAVVHLGYVATAFVTVLDRNQRKVMADQSCRTPPSFANVGKRPEQGCDVSFRGPRLRVSLVREIDSSNYTLAVKSTDLSMHATLATNDTPKPIVAICPVQHGGVNVTTKRVLMPASGHVMIGKHIIQFDNALAGMDATHGVLARQTNWHWAFAMGHASDGTSIGFNLVDDFNDAKECVVWVGDQIIPTSKAHFEIGNDPQRDPWKVETKDAAINLRFDPIGMHAERQNFGIVRSDFLQPIGTFTGTLRLPNDRTLQLDNVVGAVEEQKVIW